MKYTASQHEMRTHIEAVHKDQFKTILITAPHLYLVVTKVNNLTAKLWIDFINAKIKEMPIKKEQFKRITWLVSQKKFRREFQVTLLMPSKTS